MALDKSAYLKRRHSSLTAPMKLLDEEVGMGTRRRRVAGGAVMVVVVVVDAIGSEQI